MEAEKIIPSVYSSLFTRLNNNLQQLEVGLNESKEEFTWINNIFYSPSIRYGHLEYFKGREDKIEVVHCVLWPSYFKGIPIFGFDIIRLGEKVTGVFCDYTPSPFKVKELSDVLGDVFSKLNKYNRGLPEQAKFFSSHFIAVQPQCEESYNDIENGCFDLLDKYLSYIKKADKDNFYLRGDDIINHIEGQNNYSLNQRKNTKTQKALAKYVGKEKAESFINNILFPAYKA